MKKVLLAIFLLLLIPVSTVFAQDDIATETSVLEKENIKEIEEKIQYDLPYPGMLPDNPFYILKAVRDKIVSTLINDPIKKAEFNLLTSDKRLNASTYLVKSKKYPMAVLTASKSNNYFHEAINELNKAKKAGKDTLNIEEKMKTSLKKHSEVFKILEKDMDIKFKREIISERKRLLEFNNLFIGSTQK